jgi:hypothetical protein
MRRCGTRVHARVPLRPAERPLLSGLRTSMTKQLRTWVSHPARRSCWLASAVAVPSPTASPISRMASGDLAGDGLQALDSSLVAVDACRHIEAGGSVDSCWPGYRQGQRVSRCGALTTSRWRSVARRPRAGSTAAVTGQRAGPRGDPRAAAVSASIPIAPGPIIEDIGDHKEVGEAHDQRRRGIGGIGRA